MIKAVTITNQLGESFKMILNKPDESGMIITDISGLGPVKATVNVSDSATNDGGAYNGSRLSYRNIILTLDFRLNDVEYNRHLTYKYFPVKKNVSLEIETDERKLIAYGVVESNSPNIFSEFEDTQISIICADPFLYSVDEKNTTIFSGLVPMFEFPFENNNLHAKLIEFGQIVHKRENTIYYTGDADVGITITIHALDTVRNVAIYNSKTREVMRIDTDYIQQLTGTAYGAGDDIIICTKKGMKSCTLLRAGNTYNILNAVRRGSNWFQITKGDNIFACNAEVGALECQFTIVNDVIYEGV